MSHMHMELDKEIAKEELAIRTSRFLRAVGISMVFDIQTHFKEPPPSTYGGPPAVQTGNLKASVVWEVNDGTNINNPSNPLYSTRSQGGDVLRVGVTSRAIYGLYLEKPEPEHMKRYRPFLVPALRRMVGNVNSIRKGL